MTSIITDPARPDNSAADAYALPTYPAYNPDDIDGWRARLDAWVKEIYRLSGDATWCRWYFHGDAPKQTAGGHDHEACGIYRETDCAACRRASEQESTVLESDEPQPLDDDFMMEFLATLEARPEAARALARILRLAERRSA
jgi:hypothetical protein